MKYYFAHTGFHNFGVFSFILFTPPPSEKKTPNVSHEKYIYKKKQPKNHEGILQESNFMYTSSNINIDTDHKIGYIAQVNIPDIRATISTKMSCYSIPDVSFPPWKKKVIAFYVSWFAAEFQFIRVITCNMEMKELGGSTSFSTLINKYKRATCLIGHLSIS